MWGMGRNIIRLCSLKKFVRKKGREREREKAREKERCKIGKMCITFIQTFMVRYCYEEN